MTGLVAGQPAGPARGGPAGRDAGVETLRGVAILLMVAGHVIGDGPGTGLRVRDDSGWRYAFYTLAPLRMPLFTAISGFVYALRPATAAGWAAFLAGKARRLLVPLAVVGGAFLALRSSMPGVNARPSRADLPGLVIHPYAHYWYLYALAWIFLLVGPLDALGLLRTGRRWALLLALALFAAASGWFATAFLGLGQAQILLPYFLLGLGLGRFGAPTGGWFAAAVIGAGTVGLVLYQGDGLGWWRISGLEHYLATTLLGAAAAVAGLAWRVAWRPLAVLGGYSYGIYLMHVFGTAGARILLTRLDVTALPVLALASLAAGLALPVLVQKAVERRRWPALLLLGMRVANVP